MDWPSRELSQRLAEWRLCTPRDVQRCGSAVKRLVRDLPSFDSAWIDVLLQHRLLTPYQARVLDSAYPDRLRLGPHVLQDCMEENAWRGVYRARRLDGDGLCLLTLHALHPEDRAAALESIDATIARLRGTAAEGLVLPVRAEVGGRELIVEWPDVQGTPLRELAIRRGRFPAGVVLAVARALTGILTVLEDRGVTHGDLRPRNVWLDEQGRVHLLHAGLLPALMPSFRITQELPVDVCDGVAPEVVATGRSESNASDQYSLGCLLWQLAAGRPPFPTGDGHSKVAAHRTKEVPDLRDLAPQMPDHLARVIQRLTRRLPAQRYASFRELETQVGPFTRTDRKLLRRFFHRFETEAPTQTARDTNDRSRPVSSALAALVIGGATLWLFVSDPVTPATRPQKAALTPKPLPAAMHARPIAEATHPIVQTAGARATTETVSSLPPVDATGAITLTSGATLIAKDLRQPGPLSIRASEGIARIIIREPWHVAADSIRLENVQLECHAPVTLECRALDILRSVVAAPSGSSAAGLDWRPRDPASASPGTITVQDSQFLGAGVQCASRPTMIRIANSLKTGAAPFVLAPAAGRAHQRLPIHVIHTTLRESGPLLQWSPGGRAAGQRIDLVTKACVFAPASGSPLLALSGSVAPPEWERSIEVSGLESLLQSGATLVDLAPQPGKPRGPIERQKLEVDGLMTAAIEFFGPDAGDVASSALRSTDALFSVESPPGINAAKVATRMVSR